MKFCSTCGSGLSRRVPEGDNRLRYVCDHCGAIHYQNPKIVVGCIPEWQGDVLLCRRAIQPRYGAWTLPAGFLENGETTHDGAARETLEEANARVQVTGLYTLFNLPLIDQVYMLFRGSLLDLDFSPGEESLEVRLFSRAQLPWTELAFQAVHETLRLYFQDQEQGHYKTRTGTLERVSKSPRRYRTRLL